MFHIIFLICLATIWIIFANVQDLKRNEIYNWVSFSLIIFALAFRFFYSLFAEGTSFAFFYQGLIGFVAFFILANLFYHGKIFAAGDAKLMMAMGAIIPFSEVLKTNLEFTALFFVLFLFGGAIYSLLFTFYIAASNFKDFKKEFSKQFKKKQTFVVGSLFLALLFVIFGFSYASFIWLGVFVFIVPYLYLLAYSVDNACMVKKISPNKLTEGDWIYKDIKLKNKTVKSDWYGLTKKDINLLKKNKKKVWVRYGIPYSPTFLIAFLAFVYMYFKDLGLEIIASI